MFFVAQDFLANNLHYLKSEIARRIPAVHTRKVLSCIPLPRLLVDADLYAEAVAEVEKGKHGTAVAAKARQRIPAPYLVAVIPQDAKESEQVVAVVVDPEMKLLVICKGIITA